MQRNTYTPQIIAVSTVALALPMVAHAQTIFDFIQIIIDVINYALVPLILAVAFIVFIFGIFKYFIAGADDESSRTNGRQLIVYGLIGFFVIITVWGLVNLLVQTFLPVLFNVGSPALPQAPTDPSGGLLNFNSGGFN